MAYKMYKQGETPAAKTGGIILVYGFPGVGKTSLGINAADVAQPLFYINCDRSAAHLLKNYKGEKYYYSELVTSDVHAVAKASLADATEMRNLAVNAQHGVFLIDNFSAFWDLVKMGTLVKDESGALPKDYAPANAWIRDYLISLERSGCWVVITAPAKKIWFGAKTDSVAGKEFYEAEGWKHIDYHLIGEVWLYCDTKPRGANPVPTPDNLFTYTYKGQIVYAKKRPVIEGLVVDNPTLGTILKAMKEVPSDAAPTTVG